MLHVPELAMMMARAASGPNVDEVFKTHTRTGTGGATSITPGFAPGLVWIKNRNSSTYNHYLFDTVRGANKYLSTNSDNNEVSSGSYLTSFNANGYTLGSEGDVNRSAYTFVDWLFKESPNFFKFGTFTHTNGVATQVDLSSVGVVGAVIVKSMNASASRDDPMRNWFVWHRSLTAGNNLFLNSTAAQSTTNAFVSVSGTTMTLAAGALSATYVYYALAHKPGGIIQCGSFTSSPSTVNIDLGWDTQWVLRKPMSASGDWTIHDIPRGLDATDGPLLQPNSMNAEAASTIVKTISNGFSFSWFAVVQNIYIAIKKGA